MIRRFKLLNNGNTIYYISGKNASEASPLKEVCRLRKASWDKFKNKYVCNMCYVDGDYLYPVSTEKDANGYMIIKKSDLATISRR